MWFNARVRSQEVGYRRPSAAIIKQHPPSLGRGALPVRLDHFDLALTTLLSPEVPLKTKIPGRRLRFVACDAAAASLASQLLLHVATRVRRGAELWSPYLMFVVFEHLQLCYQNIFFMICVMTK